MEEDIEDLGEHLIQQSYYDSPRKRQRPLIKLANKENRYFYFGYNFIFLIVMMILYNWNWNWKKSMKLFTK